jgi:hypothetical protein
MSAAMIQKCSRGDGALVSLGPSPKNVCCVDSAHSLSANAADHALCNFIGTISRTHAIEQQTNKKGECDDSARQLSANAADHAISNSILI